MDAASALLVGILLGTPGGSVGVMGGYAWDVFAVKAHVGVGQSDSGSLDGWGAMIEATLELPLFDGGYLEPGVAVAYTDLGDFSDGLGKAAVYGGPVLGVTFWGMHVSGGLGVLPYYFPSRRTAGLETLVFPVLQFGWQGRFSLGGS